MADDVVEMAEIALRHRRGPELQPPIPFSATFLALRVSRSSSSLRFLMSQRNIASLAAPIRLFNGDYRALLAEHRAPDGHRLVAFLAPPWGDALSADTGLDLGRTKPPIREIISDFERNYPDTPILYVVEVHERLVPEPVAALRGTFEWSELTIYDLAGPTGRHGVLLGTRRWRG
jgi:hypothetical protein